MNYSDFTATDFAKDEYFQAWVFNASDEHTASFWKSWLHQHPEKRLVVEEARQMLLSVRFSNYTLDEEEISQLWSSIHQLEAPLQEPKHRRQENWFKAGTAAALVLMVGLLYFYQAQRPWREYRTTFGETRTYTLPDGSSVVLNANSKLTLFSDWNDDPAREIWLDGEAFFSVVHNDANQLFRVHAREGLTVEVLGTTFNVYNRTNSTKIVLSSGQIRLNIPSAEAPETVLMKPGEMVEYKGQHYNKKSVDPKLYSAWTDNRIILDHTSLAEMVDMLEDNYGLKVIVKDTALLKQTVSGSMPLGDAGLLIKQLGKAFRLKITSLDKTVTIEEL